MSWNFSKEEDDLVSAAMGFPREPYTPTPGDRARESHAEARGALANAKRAARRNDRAAAKYWTDMAKRMADIAAELARIELPPPSWEEEEAACAELIERISKITGDEEAMRRWLVRKEIWDEMAAEAERTGAPPPSPMPPRPPHWTDDLPEDLRNRVNEEGY